MSIESHKKMLSRVHVARLAQSVEHDTLNLRVVGSSPTLGEHVFYLFLSCAVTFMICFDMINMPETLLKARAQAARVSISYKSCSFTIFSRILRNNTKKVYERDIYSKQGCDPDFGIALQLKKLVLSL